MEFDPTLSKLCNKCEDKAILAERASYTLVVVAAVEDDLGKFSEGF
jgi:hypothetical protein